MQVILRQTNVTALYVVMISFIAIFLQMFLMSYQIYIDILRSKEMCSAKRKRPICKLPNKTFILMNCCRKDLTFNTLRPRQSGRHFADDIFKCIFLNENAWISLKISLKFVPKVRINNIPTLVQIMAWRRPGDKPLSESMLVILLTHICVTRPQWVNL